MVIRVLVRLIVYRIDVIARYRVPLSAIRVRVVVVLSWRVTIVWWEAAILGELLCVRRIRLKRTVNLSVRRIIVSVRMVDLSIRIFLLVHLTSRAVVVLI